jgi:hypothetical protein
MVEGRKILKKSPPQNELIRFFKGIFILTALSSICHRQKPRRYVNGRVKKPKARNKRSAFLISFIKTLKSILLNLNKRKSNTALIMILSEKAKIFLNFGISI